MRITGLVTGTESVKSVDPQPLGNSGLYITFPESVADKNLEWEINIPNKKASDYQENYNLYQEAIQTRNQTIQAAEASIKTAEAGLGLKSSGTRPADINVQNAQVNGAYAELQNAQAQLAKTIVSAPFGGVVTKMDAKVGEIVSTETSGISLISTGIFQIESNVPEVYVAQIKVENTANITLDAYGEGVSFEAKVVAIDPAPTLVDGVSNYKTTLQFLSADDRIRSGMTAKSKIITSSIANTFVVPHSAILTVNGEKFIDVMEDTQAVRRKVSVGASSLTEIQIIDGLNDGDVVVLNPVTP
jgi:RND family efflux transporter MFP subunit